MAHPQSIFCLLTASVVFADRSKLGRGSQLLIFLSYVAVPAWAQPIIIERVYTLADKSDTSHALTTELYEVVSTSVINLSSETPSTLPSSTELSSKEITATTSSATWTPVGQSTLPRTIAGLAESPMTTIDSSASVSTAPLSSMTVCLPDMTIPTAEASSSGSAALPAANISVIALNILVICALAVFALLGCKRNRVRLAKTDTANGQYTYTKRRVDHESLPRLQLPETKAGSSSMRTWSDSSMASSAKEIHSIHSTAAPLSSPVSTHSLLSPAYYPTPLSPTASSNNPDRLTPTELRSFHPIAPQHKRSLSTLKSLSLKASRSSLSQ